ncbi:MULTISPECIES: UDP-4-amino-4,6-dideoxy-N-acetyl-beta-L-altrosamine N-acetyltransferase [unclassified Providencia]|uniref:UDP-4-amino-4, 6-dideoxy-N-acetyl-beta-L-altrosamine N-acetyltransferase n=1 Tax=unclassified Providencia TaxID=2633465 RepID=UPI0023491928|nr:MULTISPECIES: UDP-4-amino-4,6-dideoxy-N-acetyl-beta-L-altrosamine N-acetyltransferase [unclassified Providencia]
MSKKKVVFLPLKENHLEMVLAWRNKPEVRMNMYTSHEITLEEHTSWFERISKDTSKFYFLAYLNEEPIGVVGFYDVNKDSKIAKWAFYASPNAPRGSGALMEYAALDYAFISLKLYKLSCEVLSFNTSVVKLHTKFGFHIEGTHRDAFYDGENYHNIIYLGIFNSEWNQVRSELRKRLKLDQ